MFVKNYGTGEDTIFALHGWGGSHRTFEPLEQYIPVTHKIIAVDLPGYGSSQPPNSWTIQAVTDELVHVFENNNIRKCTLLGNCSGAIIGLYLDRLIPDRIDKFILIDTFAFIPLYFRLFLLGSFGQTAYLTTFATPLGRTITNFMLRNRRTSETDLTASFAQINHLVVYRYLQMMEQIGDVEAFRDISKPITLVMVKKRSRRLNSQLQCGNPFGSMRKSSS